MQLTQSKSVPDVHRQMVKSVSSNKPKVPHKPSHLTCIHRKSPSLPLWGSNIAGSSESGASKSAIRRKAGSYEDDKQRRKSSHDTVTSNQFAGAKRESQLKKRNTVDYHDYVEINCPCVEPGTLIRADPFPCETRKAPSTKKPSVQERRKPTARSISDTSLRKTKSKRKSSTEKYEALIDELRRNFRSSSMEEINNNSLKPSSTADESGYEMPLSFQTPTYMCLDEDLGPFSYDESEALSDTSLKTSSQTQMLRNKKVRLARYRRRPQNQISTIADKRSQVDSKTGNDKQNDQSDDLSNDILASTKPVTSFLASRLQSLHQDGQAVDHHQSLINRTSLSSSVLTCSTCESSEDEWSDSSEESLSEYESYYQQINSLARPKQKYEHPYETIEEFYGLRNDKEQVKNTSSYELENKETDNSDGGVSSIDSSSPVTVQSNADAKSKMFQDMKRTDVRDCTWDTVATPGVLKLSELKNVLKINVFKGVSTTESH